MRLRQTHATSANARGTAPVWMSLNAACLKILLSWMTDYPNESTMTPIFGFEDNSKVPSLIIFEKFLITKRTLVHRLLLLKQNIHRHLCFELFWFRCLHFVALHSIHRNFLLLNYRIIFCEVTDCRIVTYLICCREGRFHFKRCSPNGFRLCKLKQKVSTTDNFCPHTNGKFLHGSDGVS